MPAEELIADWLRRAAESQYAHYECAKHFARQNYFLGVPVVVISAIVGTAIFASLEKQPDLWIRVVAGLTSVTAGVLSALQTFLRFAERAEKHRAAGATFGAIRRQLQQLAELRDGTGPEVGEALDRIRERFDSLAQQSPEIPKPMWDRLMGGWEWEESGK